MDVHNALAQAIDDILDKMAFMVLEEYDEPPPESAYRFFTHTTFDGLVKGDLTIYFSENVANQLARNLIGIRDEDELYAGTREDAIREFTNMVIGRSLTMLSPVKNFELTVPTLLPAPQLDENATETVEVSGKLEENPFKAVMQIFR